MKEYKYVSYGSAGVDATEFYRKFNTDIAHVSREVGISRQSVSRLVINGASKPNTKSIILHLEEISVKDYQRAIVKCESEILDALKKLEKEWEGYKEKEEIIEKYRVKHNISRKTAQAEKVSACNVLEKCKKSP